MKLSERITEDDIQVVYTEIPSWPRRAFDVRLWREGENFELPDPFESPNEPTPFDVLDLITLHCSIVNQVNSREEWAAEYTADPREQQENFPEEGYRKWKEINRRLRCFLGEEKFQQYLYDTDRSG
jgi:hypothetical protein